MSPDYSECWSEEDTKRIFREDEKDQEFRDLMELIFPIAYDCVCKAHFIYDIALEKFKIKMYNFREREEI